MVNVLVRVGLVGWGGYYPRLAFGCVLVEVEEVVEALLDGVEVGEHASCSGAAAVAGVDQDAFADAAQGGQQVADGQVYSGVFGFAAHQVGDGQREDTAEDVATDLLIGPMEHRGEGHHVGVFELSEA